MRNALISIQLGLTCRPWGWTSEGEGAVEGFRGKGGDWGGGGGGGGGNGCLTQWLPFSADMGSAAARVSEGAAGQGVPNPY